MAAGLASSSLAGDWSSAAIAARARVALGRDSRWLTPLAKQIVLAYERPPFDRPRELAAWIEANDLFQRAWRRSRVRPQIHRWMPFHAGMAPM
ncbi:MAG: hypothetical protein ACRDZ8_15185, partial [Acidimicrobiales bacterium]